MKLFSGIVLFTFTMLFSCNNKPKEVIEVDYSKIVLISLDSSINCELLVPSDSISLGKENYSCFVVDSIGKPLFTKTCSVELNEADRNYVKSFFKNLKKDSTQYENLPSLQSIFRDAVMLYQKGDTLPSVIYHLNFSMGQIYSKNLPESNEFAYSYPGLYYDLSSIFKKNGLKSNDVKNWR